MKKRNEGNISECEMTSVWEERGNDRDRKERGGKRERASDKEKEEWEGNALVGTLDIGA